MVGRTWCLKTNWSEHDEINEHSVKDQPLEDGNGIDLLVAEKEVEQLGNLIVQEVENKTANLVNSEVAALIEKVDYNYVYVNAD